METRVTYRASQETVERLRELAEKYGISQSALLTMLVNERWLAEKQSGKAGTFGGALTRERGEAPNVPEDINEQFELAEEDKKLLEQFPALQGMQPIITYPGRKKKRKRH